MPGRRRCPAAATGPRLPGVTNYTEHKRGPPITWRLAVLGSKKCPVGGFGVPRKCPVLKPPCDRGTPHKVCKIRELNINIQHRHLRTYTYIYMHYSHIKNYNKTMYSTNTVIYIFLSVPRKYGFERKNRAWGDFYNR